jgi:predicted transcriptional regulator
MAQKTIRQDLSKARKPFLTTEDATKAEASVKVPQTDEQEYPEVYAAIDRGLADVAAGRVHRRSFAEYADIEIEEAAPSAQGDMTTDVVGGKTPQAESAAPAEYEEWLYNNPKALAEVKRGLADSAAGCGVKMSFLEFADIDTED